jgi:DNA-binding winged helix-turn-helix (wHTH) protein
MDDTRHPQRAMVFAGFALNPARGALRRPDGSEVTLRPKTCELLAVLVAEQGRVVGRAALLDAVWPGVTVTDESLTQAIGELRRALGPQGAGLIRTLARRGYVLDAAPACAAPAAPDGALGPAAGAAPLPRLPGWRRHAGVLVGVAILAAGGGTALLLPRPAPPPGATGPRPAGPAAPDPGTPAPAPEDAATTRAEAVMLARQGVAWFQRERGPAAWRGQRDLFRRAAAIDPTLPAPWIYIAFTTANLVHGGFSDDPAADGREAEAAARRGIALAPTSSDAHAALAAVTRFDPARLQETHDLYAAAVALNPAAHPSRANLGWTLALMGRAAEGEPHLRAVLAAAPPDHPFRGTWHYQAGMIDLLLGRPGHGEDALRRGFAALGRGGGDGPLLALAAALALNGRIEEAAYLVRDARQRRPGLSRAAIAADPPWRSSRPAFLAQRARILEALALAGLP